MDLYVPSMVMNMKFERARTVGIFLHKDIILVQVLGCNTQDQSAQHLCRPNATWTLSCLSSALCQVNVRIVKYIHHHTSRIYLHHSRIRRENHYLQATSSLHRHMSHSMVKQWDSKFRTGDDIVVIVPFRLMIRVTNQWRKSVESSMLDKTYLSLHETRISLLDLDRKILCGDCWLLFLQDGIHHLADQTMFLPSMPIDEDDTLMMFLFDMIHVIESFESLFNKETWNSNLNCPIPSLTSTASNRGHTHNIKEESLSITYMCNKLDCIHSS